MKRGEQGFSLVEAVLTILFIGIGVIGVMTVFRGSTASALKADQTVVASNLAREVYERMLADRLGQGYDTMVLNGASHYCNGSFGGNFSGYSCAATFQEVTAPSAPDGDSNDDFSTPDSGSDCIRVTITISWNGGSDSVEFVSLISDWVL